PGSGCRRSWCGTDMAGLGTSGTAIAPMTASWPCSTSGSVTGSRACACSAGGARTPRMWSQNGPSPGWGDAGPLFPPPSPGLGCGHAVDHAAELLEDSVLRAGLLPVRGNLLGFRGVDNSAIGGLPGEQPTVLVPVMTGVGTDEVRIDYAPASATPTQNLPDPSPVLSRHWEMVLSGFPRMTARLRDLDRAGRLDPLLAEFADCPI